MNSYNNRLPIYKSKDYILQCIQNYSVSIIISPTGSGKTTQIPQYLHEAGWTIQGKIAITQPRRVAAISIATRVAEEMNVKLGSTIGYTIRFEDISNKNTKIKYLTDGVLLKEITNNNILNSYSVIILDEVHERSLYTDILFSLLKKIIKSRPELKIIIMSATLSIKRFSNYFENTKVISIQGSTYTTKILNLTEPESDYIEASIITVLQIHTSTTTDGHILVFLTGENEIETALTCIKNKIKKFPKLCSNIIPLPLYAALPTYEQIKIFEKAPKDHRKVIFATNIAETSITINDAVYVVDCGYSKKKKYDIHTGINILTVEPISKSEAIQRCGRAGRVRNGQCYRLYTEEFYERLKEDIIPEILRINLSQLILQLKLLKIKKISDLNFISKPNINSINQAMKELIELKAIDHERKLTKVGKIMSILPLDPKFSKALISSIKNGCLNDMVTIIAMLCVENVWISNHKSINKIERIKKRLFKEGEGEKDDIICLLNAYNSFIRNKDYKKWCKRNSINRRAIIKAYKIKKQLMKYLINIKIEEKNFYMENNKMDLIKQSLLEGFFKNTAKLYKDNSYRTIHNKQLIKIHPSSLLFYKKPKYIMYSEICMTSKKYVRNVAIIKEEWVENLNNDYL